MIAHFCKSGAISVYKKQSRVFEKRGFTYSMDVSMCLELCCGVEVG